MGNAAAELLERVAQAHGRLLRVAGESGGDRRLVLVFDVGVVALRAAEGALAAEVLAPGAAPPAARALDEEEPWWALLGQPLTRVQEQEGGSLRVQFRADAESPRVLSMEATPAGVRVLPVPCGRLAAADFPF